MAGEGTGTVVVVVVEAYSSSRDAENSWEGALGLFTARAERVKEDLPRDKDENDDEGNKFAHINTSEG